MQVRNMLIWKAVILWLAVAIEQLKSNHWVTDFNHFELFFSP